MRFLNGHHFKYELMKSLVSRGIAFTEGNLQDASHPNNRFSLCIQNTAEQVSGVPFFDDLDYTYLNGPNADLDSYITSQLALPAGTGQFPYDVIMMVNGHKIQLVTNGIQGRRPNDTYDSYPIVSAELAGFIWNPRDAERARTALASAGVPLTAEIRDFNPNQIEEIGTIKRFWTNTNTLLYVPIDQFLDQTETRYRIWLAQCALADAWSTRSAEIRRVEEENRRREEAARIERQREEQRRLEEAERERSKRMLDNCLSRSKAFESFAAKRKEVQSVSVENMEKFLKEMSATPEVEETTESHDLTRSALLSYTNGVEMEIVSSADGVFVKNLKVPQDKMKKLAEIIAGI